MHLLLILFCRLNVDAQILTIDKTDTADYAKKTVCKGNISVGLEGDKQKKLLLDGSNFVDLQFQRNKDLLILAASYRFTYNDGEDFLNAGYVHLRWRHGYKNTWQPETYVQFQWDNARGLLQRSIAGINLRYNIWHQHEWEISFASGFMYEHEIWNYTAVDSALKPLVEENQVSKLAKSNNYIRWEGKISSTSNLLLVVFYQTPFNNLLNQFRIASNIRFEVAFAKHFDFAISLNSLYDSKPVVPIFKFYYNFSNALVYKF